jgi:hypothetical protein
VPKLNPLSFAAIGAADQAVTGEHPQAPKKPLDSGW